MKPTASASMPPVDIEGIDPAWSRLVHTPSIDGVGRTWHVLDNGVGESRLTLLCVHGNPSWSFLFRRLLAGAPPEVRVVAVDQLEMGFSERSGTVRRLATRIDDLAALTAELGIDGPVATVAHDWGGPISLGWGLAHRDQLMGIVLMNTAVHQPEGSPAPSIIRLARSRPMLRNATVRTTSFITGAVEMSRPRLDKAVRHGFLAPYRTADRREAIADFVADIPLEPDHASAAALDEVAAGLETLADVPALLIWGARDPVFSDLYLHDLERRLPQADVHRHPAASHFVSEEVDAAGAVFDWIQSHALSEPGLEPGTEPGSAAPTSLTDTFGHLGGLTAIAESGRSIDFATFAERVDAAAAALAASGVAAGDRVALMVPPGVDLAVVLYACWHVDAVVVLIDSGLGPRGMSAAMRSADPQWLIGIPRAMAAARAMRWPGTRIAVATIAAAAAPDGAPSPQSAPVPDRSSPAAVVFTSGATGPSKGVVYTHAQLEAQRDAIRSAYGISGDDRLVAAFAPFALYGPALGITSMVPDMDVAAPGTLTARALADAVSAIDATLVFASPAALANVVRTSGELTDQDRAAFARVRVLLSAGAPVRRSLLADAAALFVNASAHTPYGMTECLPVASISLAELGQLADSGAAGDGVCVGRPVDGVEALIAPLDGAGNAGAELTGDPDVVGEIVVRAAHARAGYDRLWHTQHKASQPPGWHRTGDVGHLDHEGRLWVGGRMQHVITTPDGLKTPVGAEQLIEDLDDVVMAAVVGVGPVGRQATVAVVQHVDGPRRPRLASPYECDRVRTAARVDFAAVFVVPSLPVDRRHNSKIDRSRVAEWASEALARGSIGRL